MRQYLLFAFLLFAAYVSFAQGNCNSLRYQDTIFHSVKETDGIYFATAVPFGLFAQPQDLYLDFYEPQGDTLKKRPLIIFQFGGGFTIGWRSEPDIPAFCNYFAQLGYAVASIDYRIGLNPLDQGSTVRAFYRGVQDERSAIRFLCQRADQFKIDTSLIILTGTSAGCFCAFANAFMSDANRPAATFGTTLEPDDLGCMDCSGNNDFGHRIPKIKAIIDQWGAMLDTSYIEASEQVPTILIHGDQDILVPYVYGYPFQLPVFPQTYGAVPIHQRMDNLGIPNVLHPLVGYSHEPELLAPNLNDTIYNYSRRFLYPLLKPTTPAISGDTMICAGLTAHYTVAQLPGAKYCWQLNNAGTIISNSGNGITVLWTDTGMVSLSVNMLSYIQVPGDPVNFETRVIPHSTAAFTLSNQNLTVSVSNQSQNADNYMWQFGNGDTSTVADPVETYTSPGTYMVSLISTNGFCADTSQSSITVDSCPVAGITFSITNLNALFYADTTNTLNYSWNFGDGDSITINGIGIFHQYDSAGTYNVVLKVQNAMGCIAYDTTQVKIDALPTGLIGVNDFALDVKCDLLTGCRISSGSPKNYTVEIFDLAGRKLLTHPLAGDNFISSQTLPSGIYFIRVSNSQTSVLRKFIKQ